MSTDTEIAELLRKAAHAETQAEQVAFARQAYALQTQAAADKRASYAWNDEDAFIRDTLVPAPTHELHTAATDWLTDLDTTFDPREASQQMVAEASLWYGRVSDDVKSYPAEYAEQAKNLARRLAGQYGDSADIAERAFTDEAARLRTTAVRNGLVAEADLSTDQEMNSPDAGNATDDPSEPQASAGPTTASLSRPSGDSLFYSLSSAMDETSNAGSVDTSTMFPAANGDLSPEQTSSMRAPALQELQGTPSQDVVPVNDPGLQAAPAPFPVGGTQMQNSKESSMSQSCPTCGGPVRSRTAARRVALPEIGDITKLSASGLDQIQEIADAKDNPKTTPLPEQVAFPYTLNPAQQVPATIAEAEAQIAERSSKSPLQPNNRQSVESNYRTQATGRDNSGWIGDMGGRGTDYPGEQAPTGDASSSDGYVDPVYGQGGDQGNQPMLPYGHQEADDTTNQPNQWQVGQPTQMDNGWREAVLQDPTLASAYDYINKRYAAHNRSGR